MADKKKSTSTTTRTKVVTASDDASDKKKPKVSKKSLVATKAVKATASSSSDKKVVPAKKVSTVKPKKAKRYNVFAAFWGYLKGALYELRQVRWPNRKETWGMTFAVIAFTMFFVALVLLLDAGYKYLFDIMLKR